MHGTPCRGGFEYDRWCIGVRSREHVLYEMLSFMLYAYWVRMAKAVQLRRWSPHSNPKTITAPTRFALNVCAGKRQDPQLGIGGNRTHYYR